MKQIGMAGWLPLWYKELTNETLVNVLEYACELLGTSLESWIEKNSELLIHPRNTIDESTLGMHQDWTTNLMPFRMVDLKDGRKIYLFQCHIDDLIGSLKASGYDQGYHFVLT